MLFIDWLIVLIPLALVIAAGIYSRKYIKGVSDFLSAGRVAGRYVISMGEVASALALVTLLSQVEIYYKVGFATTFWTSIMLPVATIMSLMGYCFYRFRETRAMSLGQFLEMRYNRPFRIFASTLRSVTEILGNMIMPALAARFFIYFLDLPHYIKAFGVEISTFNVVIILTLTIAIALICFGGTLTLLVTDALQGLLLFPMMAVFVVFILIKFNWFEVIEPVMYDRVPNESFLNPYDIKNLRDFNLVSLIMLPFVESFLQRASWIGAGNTTAARNPHEQKMAIVLGSFRGQLNKLFYLLIGVMMIVFMTHSKFAEAQKKVQQYVSKHIAEELVAPENRADFAKRISEVPANSHTIGVDTPLSDKVNTDTPHLQAAHKALKEYSGETEGNALFGQYRTLYRQQMLAGILRELLPPVLKGLFCLLIILAIISTDDTRIFSASMTVVQDSILPFMKNPPTPKQHIRMLQIASIGVGVIFFLGSNMMSQLDYIALFITLMCNMWLAGCGPVMIFGLYGKLGNAASAFASLVSGMIISIAAIVLQRNWAATIYPWLNAHNYVEPLDNFLRKISAPMNPYIEWKMDPITFPINSYEIYLFSMLFTTVLYLIVAKLTQKEPFNIERMLHRGIYNVDGEEKGVAKWTLKNIFSNLIGITPEFSRSDKFIAYGVFFYDFIWRFFICFIAVVIWNMISPWSINMWGKYFLIVMLVIPGIIAFFATFWFGIGGARDIARLAVDLKKREVNHLDNGTVEGNVSVVDINKFKEAEQE